MRHEVEQWELDSELPPPPKSKSRSCKFTQNKAVLRNEDPDEPELKLGITNGGGLHLRFTSHQEHTTEEVVQCDLGHKHRKVITKDFTWESFSISRTEAKLLLHWLKERIK